MKNYPRADAQFFADIPEELKKLQQWVAWRLEPKPEKPDRLVKMPINSRTGGHAMSNNPGTWNTWDAAVARFQKSESLLGVGFVFDKQDPYTGIDFDGCRDPQTSELHAWVSAWLEKFGSYAEVSPSATGVKLIIRGRAEKTLSKTKLSNGAEVEIYSHGRFFALTGIVVNGTSAIADAQGTLADFQQEVARLKIKEKQPSGKKRKDAATKITAGERNPALFAKGVELRKKTQLTQPEIEAALLKFNELRCVPPKPESEVLDIARRVSDEKYAPDAVRAIGSPPPLTTNENLTIACEDAVDGAALVTDVESFINQFVKVPKGLALGVALWAIGTHLFQSFEVFPYLAITGPTKRCGKTRLTETLERLCAKARRTSNISEAALFRIIEAFSPALIIDEAEALADKRNERSQLLVGILNSGHRVGANVVRCIGPQHQIAEYRTFCPKVIVAIGSLRDTLADRSIMVQMQRKAPNDKVARFLLKEVAPIADKLRQKIVRVVTDRRSDVENAFRKIDCEDLEDREAENWSPLLALCEVLAPNRLSDLKVTAVRNGMEKGGDDAEESLSIKLLTDIRDVLIELNLHNDEPVAQKANAGISTRELLDRLRAIQESPWTEEDLNLTPRMLARMLRPFRLSSITIDTAAGERAKGYKLSPLRACLSIYTRPIRTSVQDDETK